MFLGSVSSFHHILWKVDNSRMQFKWDPQEALRCPRLCPPITMSLVQSAWRARLKSWSWVSELHLEFCDQMCGLSNCSYDNLSGHEKSCRWLQERFKGIHLILPCLVIFLSTEQGAFPRWLNQSPFPLKWGIKDKISGLFLLEDR